MNTNIPIKPIRITPEGFGISSSNITAILEGLKEAEIPMHSVLIMLGGQIIAEAYAEGYDKNSLQRIYSVSKSFVGMAIGALADEGRISLDSPVADYFKKNSKYASAIEKADRRIKETTVRDLLKMTSPYHRGSAYKGDSDRDWVMTFFTNSNRYALKEPGESYLYDTGGTHLLSALAEEVTGKNFLEYLKEKALNEIGFSENAWCINAPEGYAWGGSGVLCTTRDLAMFANLVMHEGKYCGKQLLPAEYIREATKKQVDNSREMDGEQSYAKHFYAAGYGYQIWKIDYTERSFAFLGMGDQNVICIPEKDLLFVCTADSQGMPHTRTKTFELFDKNILQKISDTALPEDPEALAEMDAAIAEMRLPIQKGDLESDLTEKINGVTFQTSESANISAFTLHFHGKTGLLTYKTPRGEKQLPFGIGSHRITRLKEPQYSGATISVGNGKGYRSAVSAAWSDAGTFVISVQVIDDYLGNMRLAFDFKEENTVKLTVKKTAEWFLTEYTVNGVNYRIPAEI